MSQFPDKSQNPFSAPQKNPNQPYHDVRHKTDPSRVLFWQMVYVILMILLYSTVMLGAFLMFVFAAEIADAETSEREIQTMAILFGFICLPILALYVVGLFWRRGKSGWIYQIVLIAIGLTSCATWPLTIPLIVGWVTHRDAIVDSR